MHILGRSRIAYSLTLGLMLGLGVGAISVLGTDAGWPPGLVVLLGFLVFAFRKPWRRWRATRNPLPQEATAWLETHVPVYGHLAAEARRRFDTDVQIVLDEWRFEGVGEAEVSNERRLGVAAGVALLMHGHSEWELPYRQGVLFYDDGFDDDYLVEAEGEFDGMAHQQGPIILSVKALDETWQGQPDGGNLVLHELAHLLDYKTEFADGVPSLLDSRSADAWQALVRSEMERIKRGHSVLPDYGATEPAEFFACAVESFFEEPDLLESRHPELFAALSSLFNMDPRTGALP